MKKIIPYIVLIEIKFARKIMTAQLIDFYKYLDVSKNNQQMNQSNDTSDYTEIIDFDVYKCCQTLDECVKSLNSIVLAIQD